MGIPPMHLVEYGSLYLHLPFTRDAMFRLC